MARILAVALVLAFATSRASAFCFQGSDIDGALRYLVCLHNEQADSINELSRTVSSNADAANSNAGRQSNRIEELEGQVRDLQTEIANLRDEIDKLEAR